MVASGLAILLRPGSALWDFIARQESDETAQLANALCRPEGWDIRLNSGTSTVSTRMLFERDLRFQAYPQGSVRLLTPSRFLANDGLWSVEGFVEGPMPINALQVCLRCQLPIADDVPAGQLYMNANLVSDEQAARVAALTSGRVDGNEALCFDDARLAVKESGGLSGIAGVSSLKVVGTFDARAFRSPRPSPPPLSPPPSSPPPPTLQMRQRLLAALFLPIAFGSPLTAARAADLGSLARQPLKPSDATLPVNPIFAAQQDVRALLADEETFRTMVRIGLNTGALQMPPNLTFNFFKRFEAPLGPEQGGEFMDAAIEYIEYTRDANDLVQLAKMSRTNGGGPVATSDYLDRAIDAARGASRALDRMVRLLPPQ